MHCIPSPMSWSLRLTITRRLNKDDEENQSVESSLVSLLLCVMKEKLSFYLFVSEMREFVRERERRRRDLPQVHVGLLTCTVKTTPFDFYFFCRFYFLFEDLVYTNQLVYISSWKCEMEHYYSKSIFLVGVKCINWKNIC